MDENYRKFIRDEYSKYDRFVSVSDKEDFESHSKKWNFFHFSRTLKTQLNEPGEIFLYEIFDGDKQTVSYPKVGIFLNYLPCDQTLEMEWMDRRRTWESNRKYRYNFKDGGYHDQEREYGFYYVSSELRVQSMPEWHDYHLIYGVWDRLPDWKTLRRHYEQTWWFKRTIEEKRDIDIDMILGN